MKNYHFNLKLFLIVAGQISIGLTTLTLYWFKSLPADSVKDVFLHSELILLPLTLLYWYFENYGWHQKFWQWTRHLLRLPPDLRGRWEGKIYRTYPDIYESHFVLEIEQTMTKLQVYGYTGNKNKTESILDEIACDIQHEKNFKLCFLWEGKATKLPNQKETSGKFMGYTILDFNDASDIKELEGDYFTDRKPEETQGKVELKWIGHKLKKKY